MKKLLFAALCAVMLFVACTTEDDVINNVITGTITSPTTWTADRPWIIDGGVYIASDLVIEPGTTIKFNEGAYLIIGAGVYGSLTALGTLEKPITFTSNANIPSAGDWRGIEFWEKNAKTSALAFCTIEYAGNSEGYGASVYIYDTEVSLVSCTIKKSETQGVFNQNGSFKLFNLNTISECADYPVSAPVWTIHTISSGNVISGKGIYVNNSSLTDADVTWNLLTVPYIINWIEINENATLTIEPGSTLKFLADGGITVGNGSYGKIVANGTALLPITFTTSASTPSSGDWRGIDLWEKTSNGTIFNHCKILYGGSSEGYRANIYAYDNGSNVTISNSTISYSENCGIKAENCTPTISNVVYIDNANDECGDIVP